MPVYFEYLLKVSVCLVIIFLFYALLLKRMTYYSWNRYFLLVFSILSFIVPFINISVFVQAEQTSDHLFVDQIPTLQSFEITGAASQSPGMFTYWQVVSAVFLLVSFILVLRLFIQLLSIKRIKSKAVLLAEGDIKLYHIPGSMLPFSFLSSIFINKDNYSENELQKIIDHETVHVQQKHTIDVLITEVICILNWYNPFAWLIKKAVRENLEFIADDAVVRKGFDKKNYQYLLLKVTGDIPSAVACSLKFSSLKNRIVMMNKTKTSQFHLLKFVLLVPVLMLLLLAFRNKKEIQQDPSGKTQTEQTYTLSTLTYSIADEQIRALVIKEKDQSLLKPGEVLHLSLIQNEKDRLTMLLEKNGYSNLTSNAIRFMIDTATVNNSFSIEVNINVGATSVSDPAKNLDSFKPVKNSSTDKRPALIGKENIKSKPPVDQFSKTLIYSYLNAGKAANSKNGKGC